MSAVKPLWTLFEIAAATGGVAKCDLEIDGIAIDSRETGPGDLFVALPGAVTDGHNFLEAAFENGAAAALVRDDTKIAGKYDRVVVRTPDTLGALRLMGTEAGRRMVGKVIAVTGSAGKTGTRDAIARSLNEFGKTHSSVRSFNNHVGVPISLARTPRDAEFAVFEIGMSAPGEVQDLAALVKPDIAVITSIGEAHLGGFENAEQIAAAKAEIFSGLKTKGIAIINGDSRYTPQLVKAAKQAGVSEIICASLEDTNCPVHAVRLAIHGNCNCLTAEVGGHCLTYKVGLAGRHWALNSLLVLATVQAAGGDLGLAVLTLAGLEALPGRGRRHRLALDRGTCLLIDESYNANPLSVTACLEVLGREQPQHAGRRIALLGDMDELGPTSREKHLALADAMAAASLDAFFAVGEEMQGLAKRLGPDLHAPIADDGPQLLGMVKRYLRRGDLLLVKGSHSQGMSSFVEDLLHWGELNRSGTSRPLIAAE